MKRRPHGVNLDDGVALTTEEEFQLLFVDVRPEVRSELDAWLYDDEQGALLFGGQIGTGKTTLLNEVMRTFHDTPLIRMKFDTDAIDSTDGGYVMLLLGQVLKVCLNNSVSLQDCGLDLGDFQDLGCDDWAGVAEILTTSPTSLADAERMLRFATRTTPVAHHIRKAIGILLDRLTERLARQPILVADGVDKLFPHSSDYESLKNTLNFLGGYKTLFEVNAVHLFREGDFKHGIGKLFVEGLTNDDIGILYEKRLGAYVAGHRQAFPHLCHYAGGNTRQGLRLLNAYYYHRVQKRNAEDASMALACHSVSRDILGMSFGKFPSDLLQVVKRDGYIEGSVFEDRISGPTASDALYRNWIFLESGPHLDSPTQWPARLNPLLNVSIDWPKLPPVSADEERVRMWAEERELSPIGVNVPLDSKGAPDWDAFWEEMVSSESSEDEGLSTLQILEEIGAGLFGIERQDRIILAYHKRDNLEAVRDFLVGKANTYGFFPCREVELVGGDGQNPTQKLLVEMGNPDPEVIYSVDLTGEWTEAQLRDLDHRRDLFDQLQMLWWIQRDNLEHYKPYWPQLRQLFRFYNLEEELYRDLSIEEIESDIDLIQSMSADDDPEGVQRLGSVLAFLRDEGANS